MQPARARPAWLIAVITVVLLGVLGGLRVWDLGLDPPEQVVPHYRGQAHFRDEAAKAHEARNRAIFGEWRLSALDEYGFWRVQSPAWVYGEWLWFEAFGVGLIQARMFVVVHGLVALILLFWLAMVRHGLPAAVISTGLMGLNWAYLIYSRLALMEGALLCWLIIATCALAQLDRRPHQALRWISLAVFAMVVACLIKQTGLLLVPLFALALPWLGLRAARQTRAGAVERPRPSWRAATRALLGGLRHPPGWAAVLGVLVLFAVLAALFFNPEYQQRLAFNAEHFTGAQEDQSVISRAAKVLLNGLFSSRLRLMFLLFAPVMLWLSVVEIVRVAWLGWRWRRARRRGEAAPAAAPDQDLEAAPQVIDWWMMGWLILALLANLASPHRAIRFQLILVPPAAWLGGVLLARAWLHRWSRPGLGRVARAGIVTLLSLCAALSLARYALWLGQAEYSAAKLGDGLEQLIGDGDLDGDGVVDVVVVGEFAAQAVFDTGYRHFYVRPGQFNTSPEIIRGLGITHMVFEDGDFVGRQLQRSTPELLEARTLLGTLEFRGRPLKVWAAATEEERAALEAAREADARERARKRELAKSKAARRAKVQAARHSKAAKRAGQGEAEAGKQGSAASKQGSAASKQGSAAAAGEPGGPAADPR
ncbi:glycosyltransferase family 39 protein [Pseudenhygromyxa sp. WMMC2535]|uniref:ArnT family glycosyltransferase n=1 Tax=Pseudenhygromyxa sp. WMMC2535 TaxID=2712867 RepID=UPI001552938B|nr:phospholipid carrier-dependent glycosyltransferase [Pseudenhygromyxa sp. WMMC2535]NVB36470.1 glycosyltransferase family 39 protein [Pseudenhygromyxa sp. WMMC2535]